MALPTPSPTLYVSGLETKVKKPELRDQLYSLFTPYGKVIDIVAKKHEGGRGQAFVVFAEQAAATAAMRGLSGEAFYTKDLRITYARAPSSATLTLTDPAASREALAVKAAKTTISHAQGEYEQLERERAVEAGVLEGEEPAAGAVAAGTGEKRGLENGDRDAESGRVGKRAKVVAATESAAGAGVTGADVDGEEAEEEMEIEMEDEEDALPKGTTLICTNLPPECNEQIMGALFSQYTGFSRAATLPNTTSAPSSHPPPNAGAKVFRVTFGTAEQASAAAATTNRFEMQPGWDMGVSVE